MDKNGKEDLGKLKLSHLEFQGTMRYLRMRRQREEQLRIRRACSIAFLND
jgi:hypothetical protein